VSQIDAWLQNALRARLSQIREGRLDVVDGDRVDTFGAAKDDSLHATIQIRDPRMYGAIALRGVLGAAESYMDGHWTADDLTRVIRIAARNRDIFFAMDGRLARAAKLGARVLHGLRRNSKSGSRRNIAAHYDLGNEFFQLFLDPTWTYSSAIFEEPDMTLEQASLAKYDRACKKLELGPEDRVLEIGGGWGGFALHAASRYGCQVTSLTVSRQQYELARQRVAAAGLTDRVDVRLQDYRDVSESFDKLISIEMIEAVGARYFDRYFKICSERLEPAGLMLIQAIMTPDQGFEQSLRSVDFIKRYIFPGGQLPSLTAMLASTKRVTDLRVIHLEDISAHYARTLAAWREAMYKNMDRIRELGLSETFIRMWEFYLCYCEGGFAERANAVAQILFEKPGGRRDSVLGTLS